MNLNRMESHDRLLLLKKQSDYISQGCQDCINSKPQEFTMPFYIFAHSRTIEPDEKIAIFNDDLYQSLTDLSYKRKYFSGEDVPTSRMIWSPRLTKPKAQENSMLFKSYPGTDNIKVIWMIPRRELWGQYNKGNMMESREIFESIEDFKNNPSKLEERESDDLSDEEVKRIYAQVSRSSRKKEFKMI